DAIRLYGTFSPADRAPSVAGATTVSGGNLEAPALELVATAKELGKLDELARRVEKLPAPSAQAQRDRVALLACIRTSQERDAEAAELLTRLLPLLSKVGPGRPRW